VDVVGALVTYRPPSVENDLLMTRRCVQSFGRHFAHILAAIAGMPSSYPLPTLFRAFATLMIIRHNSMRENEGLYCDLQAMK
jgi:hypothetical protein